MVCLQLFETFSPFSVLRFRRLENRTLNIRHSYFSLQQSSQAPAARDGQSNAGKQNETFQGSERGNELEFNPGLTSL